MVVYADTSFLFSLYVQDANTARAAALAKTLREALIVTPLQRLELRNALRLSVFRGEITDDECRQLLNQIDADTKAGTLTESPVSWGEIYFEAEALSAAHTGKIGTRSLDILHIAAAVAMGAKVLLSFDARQKALAAKTGMTVKP